jgi:hypothetical protein
LFLRLLLRMDCFSLSTRRARGLRNCWAVGGRLGVMSREETTQPESRL